MRAAVFVVTLALAACATAPGSQAEDEATLRHFKTELWPRAYRTQDVQLLGTLLHDSFEMINAEGKRSTRQDELASVAGNRWDPGTFEYHIERLDIYHGAFAVIDGTGVAEKYRYKSSNFFVKEDGVWRAIASHVSGVELLDQPDPAR